MTQGLARGTDGVMRCQWASSTDDYVAYHDDEWGRPVRGDQALFERFTLEGFQSGLSWITILRKRENFRTAFAGFEASRVAAFSDDDRSRLLLDAGIVRHRGKIDAAIGNARALVAWQDLAGEGCLDELVWSFAEERDAICEPAEIPTSTPSSIALSTQLKKRGFRFIGPTTAYAAMQACGVVNDHLSGCERR